MQAQSVHYDQRIVQFADKMTNVLSSAREFVDLLEAISSAVEKL